MRTFGAVASTLALGTLAACGGGGPTSGGGKISDDKIVLGVITDLSGVYSELAGENAVEAVKMAVDDFKKAHADDAVTENIEVISADHQNKPEIANTKAREMYDREGVDAIFDVPTSSAALAVANVADQNQKLFFDIGAGTTELTGAQCNPYTYHYAYDTYMLAQGTGTTITDKGGENWYIIYPDYAFGQDMQKTFSAAIKEAGGTVVKTDPTPFPNDNFSTFLLKAPNLDPKPQVIGTMHAGGDLINLVKQYNEYKLKDKGVGLAVGLLVITDIHSLGADALAGTRPTAVHAGDYSAALQYLEAVQRGGTDKSDDVVKQLEGHKVDDVFTSTGTIRAEDHLLVHDAYIAQVKPSSEVKEPWDYEKIVKTIPAAEAFQQPDPACKL
jgi:branched-chain amino acid transport system substrate-binding protein